MSILKIITAKSLHDILDQDEWNVEEVKAFLQRNRSTVNEANHSNETPLLRVLKSANFSEDLVEVLLDYGAKVNVRNLDRDTPLMVALSNRRSDATIKALLEEGADVTVHHDVTGSTTLCYALKYGATKDVIEMLLEAGCHPNECGMHVSALECASDEPEDVLDEGVMEMLVNSGANLLRFGSSGESPVCFALFALAGVKDIEWLLRQGSPLNACAYHNNSVWWCFVNSVYGFDFDYVRMYRMEWTAVLRSDMTEFLSREGAGSPTDKIREDSPLGFALTHCKYETQAIEILLDHPGVDVNVRSYENRSLLHLAVRNDYCEPRVIGLLIKRGAKVDEVDDDKQTPLHAALGTPQPRWKLSIQHSIISILLKNNSPVNAVDSKGTPLRVAVESECHPDIVQLLLSAGAQVGVANGSYSSLLRLTLNQYLESKRQITLDSLKLLVKYYFIENPEFNIERLTRRSTPEILATELKHLADECAPEVQIIKSMNIDDHRTLLDLMRERSLTKIVAADKNPALSSECLNNILRIMAENKISHFLVDIAATVGKLAMEITLQELHIYSIQKRPVSSHAEEKSILLYDCVCKVIQFLTREDTMNLILAFYIPNDQTNRKDFVGNNMKRKREEIDNCVEY